MKKLLGLLAVAPMAVAACGGSEEAHVNGDLYFGAISDTHVDEGLNHTVTVEAVEDAKNAINFKATSVASTGSVIPFYFDLNGGFTAIVEVKDDVITNVFIDVLYAGDHTDWTLSYTGSDIANRSNIKANSGDAHVSSHEGYGASAWNSFEATLTDYSTITNDTCTAGDTDQEIAIAADAKYTFDNDGTDAELAVKSASCSYDENDALLGLTVTSIEDKAYVTSNDKTGWLTGANSLAKMAFVGQTLEHAKAAKLVDYSPASDSISTNSVAGSSIVINNKTVFDAADWQDSDTSISGSTSSATLGYSNTNVEGVFYSIKNALTDATNATIKA